MPNSKIKNTNLLTFLLKATQRLLATTPIFKFEGSQIKIQMASGTYQRIGYVVTKSTKRPISRDMFYSEWGLINPTRTFARWKLPDLFWYVYVSEFYIDKEYRGRGLGSLALKAFVKQCRPSTLVALMPGGKLSLKDIIQFYQKNGFYVQRIGSDTYAFFWV